MDKKLLYIILFLCVVVIIPFVFMFDVFSYLIIRPACLNCGSLVEFIRSSSLTLFLVGKVLRPQFKKK